MRKHKEFVGTCFSGNVLLKTRVLIVKIIRILKIDNLLFFLKKHNEFIDINSSAVEKAREFLERFSPNSNTTAKWQNNIQEDYDLHIIIPAYNVEKYIEQCVDSILKLKTQYSYFITIVNDGSTDRTGEILKKYGKLTNVQIINQKNKGFSGARNRALENIYGKYIMFVDSDDYIEPFAVCRMLEMALEEDYDIVQGSFCKVDMTGKPYMQQKEKEQHVKIALGTLRGYPCGKIIKSKFFKNVCFPEKYWYEDSIMAQIIFPNVKKVTIIRDVVYYYRTNPKGISLSSKGKAKSIDSLYVTLQLFYERDKFGISVTQEYYEYILDNIQLTFKRTMGLEDNVQKAIFVIWCDFIRKEFADKNTLMKNKKWLEKSLRENNFGYYRAACKYL